MVEYFLVTIFAVIFAYFHTSERNGLAAAFFILTSFVAIRYDYGNDTLGYLEWYRDLQNPDYSIGGIVTVIKSHPEVEPGWTFLNIIFKPFGFFSFQIVLSFIEGYVLYCLVRKYVPSKMYWLAIFIYSFNTNFMFIGSCSMMRQWLACIIFLYSIKYIVDKEWLKYLLAIALAVLIHKSAIVLFPLYLINFIPNTSLSKTRLLVYAGLYALWFYMSSFWGTYLDNFFMIESFSEYEKYTKETSEMQVSLLGLISGLTLPIVSLLTLNKMREEMKIYTYVNSISLLIIPLMVYASLISRLSIYFSIVSIILYPYVLGNIKQKNFKYYVILVAIITLPLIRTFLSIIDSPVWMDAYSSYQTIFSKEWQ